MICWTYAACAAAFATWGAAAVQAGDRVAWRFEIPSNYAGAFVGVGPDGVVYATDNVSLYALTPRGDLLWSMPGAGGGRPITFGGDGTIYTSAQSRGIRAVHPDGTLKWEYLLPSNRVLHTGPNVGPDGNLYGVQEIRVGEGIGAFSVNADGEIRWSNPGNPEIRPADLSNSDVVFGDGRMFAGMDYPRGHGAVTYCFGLAGQQLWQSGSGGREIPAGSFPRVMQDGRIAFRYAQVGVMAVTQDGVIDWQLPHPAGVGYLIEPTVGPDGIIYAGAWSGVRLWAVNPNGSTRWAGAYQSGLTLDSVSVSPDNSVIVATGTPGWVRGYSPEDGGLLWQVDLAPEQGLGQFASTVRAAFSPDSRTAYVTTRFVGNGVGHSYLYAIRLAEGGLAGDLNCDGAVDAFDIEPFVLAISDPNGYAARYPNCDGRNADINGDGVVDAFDIEPFVRLLAP
jgi:outer membrane protein assembly factor BamB